jgi:hypothetical protein
MMHTIKQRFGSTAHALAVNDFNTTLRLITKYAWLSAAILFASYLYFVGAITFSVIKQASLAQSIKVTMSQTGKEELKYLALQKHLSASYAASKGFVSAPVIAYTVPTRSFAWNTNAAR